MDEEHCVLAVVGSEVAKFEMPQMKRRYNVFHYVLSPTSTLTGKFSIENLSAKLTAPAGASVETTLQNYDFYLDWRYLFSVATKYVLCFSCK